MVVKNSEAQKCANTLGLLSNKSRKGNIDMNIIAKSDLNFQGKAIVPVAGISGTWLTSADLSRALNYSNSRAVTMIFNKYADEFTSGMSQVLEVSTSGNYRKKVRVFSLRGAHLIAMFARTDVAKEFRRWVLDILDREVAKGTVPVKFDFEIYAQNANAACAILDQVWDIFHGELEPALRSLASPVATKLVGRIIEAKSISYSIRGGLLRAAGDGKGRIH